MATARATSAPRNHVQSFNGGEVTPEFFGQVEDPKRKNGAARLRNMISLPHGPAQNRPGTEFVREVRDSTKKVRLIPFTFSVDQTFVLEFGEGYVRFHTQGATLLNGTAPYEVPTPYTEADLPGIRFAQSADVLTLCHENHAPRELRRLSALSWTLSLVSFAPSIAAPTSVAVTASPTPTGSVNHKYVVTAEADDSRESVASAQVSVANDLTVTANFNTVTWAATTGAVRYSVYKEAAGTGFFGWMGYAIGTSFIDDNITPDISRSPPVYETPFNSAGNYPRAVGYFDQRRVFAGTQNNPQNIWMTQTGTESVLATGTPPRDTDRIAFRIASRDLNAIRHVVSLSDLILLTNSAEWRITSVNSDAVTPTSISAKPQSYIGASDTPPALVNATLLYAAARGGHIHEMAYNWQANGFIAGDLCLRAPHLFDGLTIREMTFQRTPVPTLWAVSSSGQLRTLTYVPEESVGAWTWHDTDGVFESVCSVIEGDEDVVYVAVARDIQGTTRRYVERFATRRYADLASAVFSDSALTYTGPAVTSLGGLQHLEGKTVNILADGTLHNPQVVVGGFITLDRPVTQAVVGLPITAELQTLPLIVGLRDGSYGQGRTANVSKAWLRVQNSGAVQVGGSPDKLRPVKIRAESGVVGAENSGIVQALTVGHWDDSGQVFVRHTDPLPLTITAITFQYSLGG